MYYLVFPNLSMAQGRNNQEALSRNCGPTTPYWWNCVEHPDDGRAALFIPSADVSGLTEPEQASLVSELEPSWFPEQ